MLAQQPCHAAEAVARLDRLLALSPEAEAFNNRAVAQRDLGRLAESLADTGRALALLPDLAEAWWNRGSALHDLGRLQEAITAFRRAAELQPQQAGAQQQVCFISRVICQWANLQHDDADLLRRLQQPGPLKVSTFGLIAVTAIPAETLADVAKRAAPLLIGPLLQHPPLVAPGSWHPRERLRIGYLSADFYDHATVRLLAGVLEQHDRERFVVHSYSYGNIRDEGTARVAAISDVFHHLPEQTDEAIAAQILADEVDILVDLKGPTQHMRPQITARRPAPVIVNWLGYPGTFGHPRLADYLIGDAVVTPLEHARFYSETLALMPQGYQPNDRTRGLGARPSRGDVGLPETGFVFGSFNQTYKIDPATFAVWMRLLHALPGSVLWQLESHPDAAANLRREAAAAGIDPQRIVFAPKLGQTPHLGRLQLVDLALDTFPCNGHTTTSDALWACVPVITRIGETFASRVAASILYSIGLDELITTNEADYFACALAWARTPSALLALRSRIERNRLRSPLFDTLAFTRDLEKIYARSTAACAKPSSSRAPRRDPSRSTNARRPRRRAYAAVHPPPAASRASPAAIAAPPGPGVAARIRSSAASPARDRVRRRR
jgi:predicted O-linked N-acetylglucosamine transferase (SPINDLY family)